MITSLRWCQRFFFLTLLLTFRIAQSPADVYEYVGPNSGGWGETDNWSGGAAIPGANDIILLTDFSAIGPRTIQMQGPRAVIRIEANGVDTAGGPYTFTDVVNPELYINLTGGNAILSRAGDLQFDTDILLVEPDATLRFNVATSGGTIVVNGDVKPYAASGTTELVLTSLNTSLPTSVAVNGIISDGTSGAKLALTAGIEPDAENHNGVVRTTGLNTYTGPTIVNGAVLEFNSIADADGTASALGAPDETATPGSGTIRLGAVDTSSSAQMLGTLRLIDSGTYSSDRNFSLQGGGGVIDAGPGTLNLAGDVSAITSGTKVFELSGASTANSFAGDITNGSGVVGLQKGGTGTWRLTGNNNFTGATNINEGKLIVEAGAFSNSISTTLASDTDLQFDFDTDDSYSGTIDGDGDVFKLGTGALTLGAANTYTGNTYINGGKIVLDHANALQNSPVFIDVDNGLDVTTNGIDATVGGLRDTGDLNIGAQTLTVNTDATHTHQGEISGVGGSLVKTGSGEQHILIPTYTGSTTISAGRLKVTGEMASSNVVNNGELELTGGEYAGVISGSGDVLKDNSFQILELSGNNTYTGETVIEYGRLTVSSIADTGLASNIGAGNTIRFAEGSGTATLEYLGPDTATDRDFVIDRNGLGSILNNGGKITLNGDITGTGSISYVGDFELNGVNAYEGFTGLNALADVSIASISDSGVPGPLGIGDEINISLNATLRFTGATGSTDRDWRLSASTSSNMNIDVVSGDLTLSGTMFRVSSGIDTNLVKKGAGSLEITGANTYSDHTLVEAGTYLANNSSGSATGTGDVTIGDTATLGGDGSISGSVTAESGATVAPGNSAGILTVGEAAFNTGSTFAVELAGGGGTPGTDFDQLFVSGAATIDGGTLDVSLLNYSPIPGSTFNILTADSISGEFDSLVAPELGSGRTWYVNYSATSVDLVSTFDADFDEDGTVDDLDFAAWEAGFGNTPATHMTGDANDDSFADGFDFLRWQQRFGQQAEIPDFALTSTAVPEPSALLLSILTGLVCFCRRRR